jgi:Protein of unknown function (DUF3175)
MEVTPRRMRPKVLIPEFAANRMPATSDNAGAASGFPHCGIGTGRDLRSFQRKIIWSSVMAARETAARKTARKTATRKASATRRKTPARKASPKRWSQRVTQESDALDLRRGVFKLTSAKKIAASLKRSAEHSSRRKSGAYRSALSMLTFYINRAGKTLTKTHRERLERAKIELKHQFGRE